MPPDGIPKCNPSCSPRTPLRVDDDAAFPSPIQAFKAKGEMSTNGVDNGQSQRDDVSTYYGQVLKSTKVRHVVVATANGVTVVCMYICIMTIPSI